MRGSLVKNKMSIFSVSWGRNKMENPSNGPAAKLPTLL